MEEERGTFNRTGFYSYSIFFRNNIKVLIKVPIREKDEKNLALQLENLFQGSAQWLEVHAYYTAGINQQEITEIFTGSKIDIAVASAEELADFLYKVSIYKQGQQS